MGADIPKQFLDLCGRPVLWWSMKAFHDEDPDTTLILVLPENFIPFWKELFKALPDSDRFEHKIAKGGKTRSESVKNGLSLVDEEVALVAVHDGARPLVSTELISKGWETASEKDAGIPVTPVTDSLRKKEGSGSRAVDRSKFVAVQTPQVFNSKILKEAYINAGDSSFTDDAAVVENAGVEVALFPGEVDNIKITNPKDLKIATVLMKD